MIYKFISLIMFLEVRTILCRRLKLRITQIHFYFWILIWVVNCIDWLKIIRFLKSFFCILVTTSFVVLFLLIHDSAFRIWISCNFSKNNCLKIFPIFLQCSVIRYLIELWIQRFVSSTFWQRLTVNLCSDSQPLTLHQEWSNTWIVKVQHKMLLHF